LCRFFNARKNHFSQQIVSKAFPKHSFKKQNLLDRRPKLQKKRAAAKDIRKKSATLSTTHTSSCAKLWSVFFR